MSLCEQVDARTAQRRRVIKGGIIAYSSRHVTCPCVVRNLSDTGAQLQVHRAMEVPDTFELFIELDGFEAECVVVWRTEKELGVRFRARPKQVAPKRIQIVSDIKPPGQPSIRRRDPAVDASPRPEPEMRNDLPAREAIPAEAYNPPERTPVPDMMERSPLPVAAPSQAAAPVQNPIEAPCRSTDAVSYPGASAVLPNTIPVLIAEDDPDDRLLIGEAFAESDFDHRIEFVGNGEELLQYLELAGSTPDRPVPRLILLDLNMPKMDGRQALKRLKADPATRRIPVVVFTTSNVEQDVDDTYDLGVNSYITKPSTFEGLKDVVSALDIYWSCMAALPSTGRD